nr:AraC family transcriptional regulator [Auraticoccus cholistanensis]
MAVDPAAESSHRRAVEAYERTLSAFLPLDAAGERINEVIGWLAEHPGTTRVAELARAFGASERSLQRLVEERVGLTPKWLIQRRRLHDAVERLKAGTTSLADIAAELGYTDQAHFTRDFRTVSGQTPGQFLADQPTRR